MIPKSKKMTAEETNKARNDPIMQNVEIKPIDSDDGPVMIRRIECFNDYIAILPFRISTSVHMPSDKNYDNEGIVIGVGPGLPNGAGGRCKPTVEFGDVVVFGKMNPVCQIQSDSDVYKDRIILLFSERTICCKLPSVEYVEVE